MQDEIVFSGAARGWRFVAALALVMVVVAGHLAWDAERRSRGLREENVALRARVAEKREIVARQRQEMSAVAGAIDRLARTTSSLRERAVQARRLGHMEESYDWAPRLMTVNATLADGMPILSGDAAHALDQLDWLDRQTSAAADSIAVLMVLVRQRAEDMTRGIPNVWPVQGLVTSPFGSRISPYGENREMHPGIDIAAAYGSPVAAAGAGQVIFAGRDGGYGGLVVVDHGGQLDTLYGHLSALYVREGQHVRRGQPLGAVGATGRATGAHLHYEVRINGAPVDPRRYLTVAKATTVTVAKASTLTLAKATTPGRRSR